jgi:RNA polymerase sigma-70 factor (ECF subfamily)
VAEDLVQETFLSALGALKDFQWRSSEKTWLTGILKHKVVDHFRKTAREQPVEDVESDPESTDAFFDPKGNWQIKPAKWTVNPQRLLEQREFIDVLSSCISKLTERLAHAFVLREINGESVEEICKILNISATNCWVVLHRARMKLRQCLEVDWFEHDLDKTQN